MIMKIKEMGVVGIKLGVVAHVRNPRTEGKAGRKLGKTSRTA